MDMFAVSDLWSYYCPKAQKFYDKLEVWLRRSSQRAVTDVVDWAHPLEGSGKTAKSPVPGSWQVAAPEGSLPCRKQHQTLSAPEKLSATVCLQYFCRTPAAYVLANAKTQKVQVQQTMSQRPPPEKVGNQWPHSNSSPTVLVAWTILRYSEQPRAWCVKSKGSGSTVVTTLLCGLE